MLLHRRRHVCAASVLPMLIAPVIVIRDVREALVMRHRSMVRMRLLRKSLLLRWELPSRAGSTLEVAIALIVVAMVRILVIKIARMLLLMVLVLVLVWWKLLRVHFHRASTLSIISPVRALVL